MNPINHPAVDNRNCGPFTVHRLRVVVPSLALHRLERQRAAEFNHRQRRDEFINSRLLYRAVSGNDTPLLNRASGECIWPVGFSGSLSHRNGQVVLVYRQGTTSIGVDIEVIKTNHNDVLEQTVLTEDERRLLDCSSEHRTSLFLTMFSAKESLFKCLYPLIRKMFYFHQATVEQIDTVQQTMILVAQRRRLIAYYTKLIIDNQSYVLTVVSM